MNDFSSAERCNEQSSGAILEHARTDFFSGRFANAEWSCRQVLEQAPGHPAALRQLGLVRLVLGHAAEALTLLRPIANAFPADPDLSVALAEAEWGTNSAAAAVPYFQHALLLAPQRATIRARLGLALLTCGKAEQARQELEVSLEQQPADSSVATYLGMAFFALGETDSAISLLRRASELDLADANSVFQLSQVLRASGRMPEALLALREAVRRSPSQAYIRIALADQLLLLDQLADAIEQLQQAVALAQQMPLAWAKLGDALQLWGDPTAAARCYQRAVDLDRSDPLLRALLGNALFVLGAKQQAAAELGRSMQAAWTGPSPRMDARLRVAVLAAPGPFNTPTEYLLDPAWHAATPIFMLEDFAYPCERIAESFDIMFNAVSDADAAPDSLAIAGRLAPAIGLPVLNPPQLIAETTRERIAARLQGIQDLCVPRTRRYCRSALPSLDLDEFGGRVLLRPPGGHGGDGVVLAENAATMHQVVSSSQSDAFYVTEFVDFRSADGRYRKLRFAFIGGEMFPVHLAIGDSWLVHYFRTQMSTHPELRAEEAAFLNDLETYLGVESVQALRAVQSCVNLDYFGIDAGVDAAGKLVLFECNATMLIKHIDRPEVFDYKRAAAAAARDAFGAVLRGKALRSR